MKTIAPNTNFICAIILSFGVQAMAASDSPLIYEKKFTTSRCIHDQAPPEESVFYELDSAARLEIPAGTYLITGTFSLTAWVIARRQGDEAAIMVALTDNPPVEKAKFDEANEFSRGIGIYISTGEVDWKGAMVTLSAVHSFAQPTKIGMLAGAMRSSSGKPEYKALCFNGPKWGVNKITAVPVKLASR